MIGNRHWWMGMAIMFATGGFVCLIPYEQRHTLEWALGCMNGWGLALTVWASSTSNSDRGR